MRNGMKVFRYFVAVVLLGVAVRAQQVGPTIKGHRIGETPEDYALIEERTPEAAKSFAEGCHSLVSDPKVAKRYRKEFPADLDLLQKRLARCSAFVDAEAGRLSAIEDAVLTLLFAQRRVVMIKVTLAEDFPKVEKDLIEKLSAPPDLVQDLRFQNGFGAIFVHPQAIWRNTKGIIAVESEESKAIDIPGSASFYPVTVVIEDQGYAKSAVAQENNRPNSLN